MKERELILQEAKLRYILVTLQLLLVILMRLLIGGPSLGETMLFAFAVAWGLLTHFRKRAKLAELDDRFKVNL